MAQFIRRSDTLTVARRLLGATIHFREGRRSYLVGRIVETEAYLFNDPACHATRGKTDRNAMMFERAGYSYVYLIYGIHHCFNVVTNQEGIGEAVLIRAVEPLEGIATMKRRRGRDSPTELCNGPGKLCEAFGVTTAENGVDLLSSERLWIEAAKEPEPIIVTTTRIGISAGAKLPYRFYLKDSPFVSRL